jgi:hypothetical protein
MQLLVERETQDPERAGVSQASPSGVAPVGLEGEHTVECRRLVCRGQGEGRRAGQGLGVAGQCGLACAVADPARDAAGDVGTIPIETGPTVDLVRR